jgi:hypothetical protein
MKMEVAIGEKSATDREKALASTPSPKEISSEGNGKMGLCQAKASITSQTTKDTKEKSLAALSTASELTTTKTMITTLASGKTT